MLALGFRSPDEFAEGLSASKAVATKGKFKSKSAGCKPALGGKMAFDVASVKLNTSGQLQRSNIDLDANDSQILAGGSLKATSLPMIAFIQFAYQLQPTAVTYVRILSGRPERTSML